MVFFLCCFLFGPILIDVDVDVDVDVIFLLLSLLLYCTTATANTTISPSRNTVRSSMMNIIIISVGEIVRFTDEMSDVS